MREVRRLLDLRLVQDHRDLDLGGRNHLDVDAALLQRIDEFLGCHACHFERAAQGANGHFAMHRNNAAPPALRRVFFQDNVAATLPVNEESEALQRFDRIRAGNDWQFSHAPIRMCELQRPFSKFAGTIRGKRR